MHSHRNIEYLPTYRVDWTTPEKGLLIQNLTQGNPEWRLVHVDIYKLGQTYMEPNIVIVDGTPKRYFGRAVVPEGFVAVRTFSIQPENEVKGFLERLEEILHRHIQPIKGDPI